MSLEWDGTTVGDAAVLAPYGQDEVAAWFQAGIVYDRTLQGVLRRNDSLVINGVTYDLSNLLEVTNPTATTVRVASGGAIVDGTPTLNSANVDFTTTDDGSAIAAPGSGTNYYRVVLRKSWSAQEIRLAVLDVNTSAPVAVTQTQGTAWEISLATVAITSAGVVTVTDTRVWIGPTNAMHVTGETQYKSFHPLYRNTNNSLQADSGGNARGTQAIDLQQSRGAAGQVASGNYADISGGYGNIASGAYAHAEGYNNTASGEGAHAEGGNDFGGGVTASGQWSHGEGGSTTASGEAAHAEGMYSVASGNYAHAGGKSAQASKFAQFARGAGAFAAVGDAQWSDYILLRQVTHSDANWYQLYLNGVDALLTLASNQVMTFDALIVGTTSGCTKSFGFRIVGVIENDGGTTTLLASTVTTLYDTDDTDFGARASADDTNDALLIEVQDSTSGGNVVRWVATVRTVEITYS